MYRRRSLLPNKSESARLKKSLQRKLLAAQSFAKDEDGIGLSNEIASRITFGSMPSYREDKMKAMKSRHKESALIKVGNDEDNLERTENELLESLKHKGSAIFELSPNNLTKSNTASGSGPSSSGITSGASGLCEKGEP